MTTRSRRDRLASWLGRTGMMRPLARLWHAGHDGLVILAYHRVVDTGPEADFPWDIDLVSASSAAFDRQMAEIRRHYRPVGLEEVWRRWSRGRRLPRRAVAVTFDDGFADNATCALPILRRHGIPATVFVSSGYVGSRTPFWFDGLARWVNTTQAERMTIAGEVWPLTDMDTRRRAGWAALGHLKQLEEPRRQEQLEAWRTEIGEEDEVDEGSRPLTRIELQALVEGGVSIGSHTVSHPVLSRCDDATLKRELNQSRHDLEAMTGSPVTTLSYPVGGTDAHDHRVRQAAREAGYRLACAYVPGFNRRRTADLFALRRQRIERYIDQDRFRAMLACPEVFK